MVWELILFYDRIGFFFEKCFVVSGIIFIFL